VRRGAWVLLGVLAALWGASYMFIKIGLDGGLSAAAVVFVRTALAALVLVPVALHRDALGALRDRRVLRWVVFLALVQVVVPFLLITVGEQHITTSLAAILVASSPIFTALIAMRLDAAERSVGVALLFGVDLTGGTEQALGGLAILVASLGYAIGPLTSKHRLHGVQPVAIVTATMATSAILLVPALPFTGVAARAPELGTIAAMLALGVGGTGLAFLIFYTLIAEVGPARASVVAYIAPGFSVVYGALLLDEPVGAATLAGLGLILAGSYIGAEGRLPWAGRPVEPVGELDVGLGGEDPALLASEGHER
jgi:drug/metabolite transporter (DMT)-like permease